MPLTVLAQEKKNDFDNLIAQGNSVGTVTPIYGQVVMFSYPRGFKPAYANDSVAQYMQEWVLNGETVENWSQMVTVTGAKGLAAVPIVTPQGLLQQIASGFQRVCPRSFAAKGLGTLKTSGHDAFVALIGCGAVQNSVSRSESAILLAVRASSDYYTFQWAERAPLTTQPPVFDDEKWLARLKQLNPIKLCARVSGEQAPFPSCIDQK